MKISKTSTIFHTPPRPYPSNIVYLNPSKAHVSGIAKLMSLIQPGKTVTGKTVPDMRVVKVEKKNEIGFPCFTSIVKPAEIMERPKAEERRRTNTTRVEMRFTLK